MHQLLDNTEKDMQKKTISILSARLEDPKTKLTSQHVSLSAHFLVVICVVCSVYHELAVMALVVRFSHQKDLRILISTWNLLSW